MRNVVHGVAAMRQNAMSVVAVRAKYASTVSCNADNTNPPGRNARANGCAAHAFTRSARPAMMPLCGPPINLSPLKVTKSAPAANDWRAAGSPFNQLGGPSGNHGQAESRRPEPMSATTGTPSDDNS